MKGRFIQFKGLKNLYKQSRFALPGAMVVVLFLGLTISYLRVPAFPADLPSAQTLDRLTQNHQTQQEFAQAFSRLIRRSHGGLLLVKKGEKQTRLKDSPFVAASYVQRYNVIHEKRFLGLAQKMASQENLTLKVKKLRPPDSPPHYRLRFFKQRSLWVVVEAEASQAEVLAVAKPSVTQGPKLAIVIDDLGQNIEQFYHVARLSPDLTLSILPELPDSEQTAREAFERGMEVTLNLPMEPLSYPQINPGEGALLKSDNPSTLAKKLDKALDSVPHAVGVNSYMGSAFSADPAGMALVMSRLKAQGMYYLNSRTSATEVPQKQAQQFGVPFFSRNLFIDDTPGLEAAKLALAQAIQLAKKDGFAIAIGHPRPTTLQALKEMLPEMKRQGVQLVRASALKDS